MRAALDVLLPATVVAILFLIVLFLVPTLGILAGVGMLGLVGYRLLRARV